MSQKPTSRPSFLGLSTTPPARRSAAVTESLRAARRSLELQLGKKFVEVQPDLEAIVREHHSRADQARLADSGRRESAKMAADAGKRLADSCTVLLSEIAVVETYGMRPLARFADLGLPAKESRIERLKCELSALEGAANAWRKSKLRLANKKPGRSTGPRDQMLDRLHQCFAKHELPVKKSADGLFARCAAILLEAVGELPPEDMFRSVDSCIKRATAQSPYRSARR